MSYAIMRCTKLNSFGNVAASLQHCFRERETPNADPSQTPNNQHFAARSTNEAMGRLRAKLPAKRRKDAVLAVEYVMTASPQWWRSATAEQQQAFFQRAMNWLRDKYGADNIFAATVHHDETSPHLSAFVVPLTADGRLSAKEFIGDRRQMSADQSSFAAAVATLGLERGIIGSRAKHQTIRDYYAGLNAAEKATHAVIISPQEVQPVVLKKGIFSNMEETPEAVAERITRRVQSQVQEIAARASRSVQDGREIESLRVGIKKQQTQSERILGPLATFSKNQVAQVEELVAKIRQDNQRESDRKRQELKARYAARKSGKNRR